MASFGHHFDHLYAGAPIWVGHGAQMNPEP